MFDVFETDSAKESQIDDIDQLHGLWSYYDMSKHGKIIHINYYSDAYDGTGNIVFLSNNKTILLVEDCHCSCNGCSCNGLEFGIVETYNFDEYIKVSKRSARYAKIEFMEYVKQSFGKELHELSEDEFVLLYMSIK